MSTVSVSPLRRRMIEDMNDLRIERMMRMTDAERAAEPAIDEPIAPATAAEAQAAAELNARLDSIAARLLKCGGNVPRRRYTPPPEPQKRPGPPTTAPPGRSAHHTR
jgi:hypothetical protein